MVNPDNNYNNEQKIFNKKAPWIIHAGVSIVILIIAALVVKAMFASKPEARKWGGSQSAPTVAVDVMDLTVEDYEVWIESYGTAQPLTQTELVADVSGRVVSVAPNIRAGGSFKKGDVLVRLEDRDFQIEVDIAKSAVADANVVYLQELAEADFSAQQWNKQPSGEAAKLLALRKPQVAAAEAALRAAEARLMGAKLNLERTVIKAPFDGMVLSQSVDVGQVVSPSQTIASIYSTDVVEVRLPIKTAELEYFYLGENTAPNASNPRVKLYGDLGTKTYQWDGEIVRSEGAFDPTTRMLFLVAQVEAPFEATQQRPALRVGQFLSARVEGQKLNDVFVIPRQAVSQSNMVSVVDDGTLRKRPVTPLWTDDKNVIVSASPQQMPNNSANVLTPSDKLILTPTANIPDGTKVKSLADSLPESSAAQKSLQANNAENAKNSKAQ
ncbi:efflux RND transporter periplasmic adaptor subunit [Alteromonas hispanica]|uniref:Efflux RND transporter periplasmic adaptor subunit n=1 Tax=Alteromonas hispanica TaxID=315421 RepID=A0A6L9MVB2_9ALTE|nr:efflux RND transporter periplasmic adaptor subunit [Alteromonas hispanica]NDW22184.1 efflux RND transporter periplasmic adaptor subunit [Alteromonas hispanica]